MDQTQQPRLAGHEEAHTIGVVGTGSVGSSWITFSLARGFDVLARDPRPDVAESVQQFVLNAWPSMIALGLAEDPTPPLEHLHFIEDLEALAKADLILEAAPEQPDTKLAVLRKLAAATPPSTIIATSTGGMRVSDLQKECKHPERIVLLHPLNPAHLVPLVEVCGGALTDPMVVDWVVSFCRSNGKTPVVLRKEAIGHLTNRLQAALMREAIHCLIEGIASADDIDSVVTAGLGARWSSIGPLMTLHLAGGPGGTAGALANAGDAMSVWWDSLGTLRLTPDVRERLILAASEVDRDTSIDELIRARDARLVRLFGHSHTRLQAD